MSAHPKLLNNLLDEPYSYEFFQAVHLLEQLLPDRAPVGEFADPADEVVRFQSHSEVSFPASEIQALEELGPDEEGTKQPLRMTVNFMGLTGPQGMMPLDYSLYAARRARAGDRAFRDFLALFDHRLLSLFYRAWTRSHAAIGFTSGGSRDWLTHHLLSVVGLDTPGLRAQLHMSDDAVLHFAGLLALPSRPAAALEQLIGDMFDVPIEVEQFVGSWYPLERRAQTALGEGPAGALGGGSAPLGGAAPIEGTLGSGAVAGDEVWDQQGRVRVRVGPLTRRQYDRFLPGGDAYESLRAITRFFGNDQFDFEIQLVLARDEAPPCRLDADDVPLPLGWCTWLRTAPLDRDPDDALFTL